MEISAVIGLQFGDEGKGSFVQHLCKKSKNPIVIRFNGGHQAGHTVLLDETRHTFSSFGSGTLVNAPTYWSRFCTIFPPSLYKEYYLLRDKGIKPEIYFDTLCPITTPYDIYDNKKTEIKKQHGSVGVGFGATIKRQESFYKLHYQDLFDPIIVEAKLNNIRNYYEDIHGEVIDIADKIEIWYKCIEELIKEKLLTLNTFSFYNGFNREKYNHIIFEGAQGILLDMDFGFFPNVTRSNTTTKNIFTLLDEFNLHGSVSHDSMKIYYMTRCYQTRHGKGFMTNENIVPKLINNENEINLDSSYQGKFRKSLLDINLINYALVSDYNFSSNIFKKMIVVTCLDQLPNGINYTHNKKIFTDDIPDFNKKLKQITNLPVLLGTSEGIFKEQ